MTDPETTLPVPRIVPLKAADLPPGVWSTRVPIRFGRCDAAGIVYTPQYFDLFIGVVEVWYAEALGLDYYALFEERRIGLGYAHASCEFLAPSRMGDRWDVAVVVERLGRSSLTLVFHVMVDGSERARGRLVSVATSRDNGAVIAIPTDVSEAIRRYMNGMLGGLHDPSSAEPPAR